MSMNRPVGYLVNHSDGLQGVRGTFYDFVVAENGVFIEAEGPLLAARVPVAPGHIRGLAPLEPVVVLRNGRIPQRCFDLALSAFLVDTSRERYVAVTLKDGYHLYVPEQETEAAKVEYQVGDSIALDLHSHGAMTPRFSTTDNRDETGMKLYGVVGKLDGVPVVQLRVGVYGYFQPISWGDVFDGNMIGVQDFLEQKEVSEDELYSAVTGRSGSPENSRGRLRRNWGVCCRGAVPTIGE